MILSAVGAIYYGYMQGPYWRIIVWALACTMGSLWLERSSLKRSLSRTPPPSIIGRSLLAVAIVVMAAVTFVVGNSVIYLLARSLR